MDRETIFGQVIAKANHYLAVQGDGDGRRIIKDEAIRSYERIFESQCRVYRGREINSRFGLEIDVYSNSFRYDLDNSIKTVLDCLQMVGAITNDNLCVNITARKHVDQKNPRITFGLMEYEPKIF